MWEDKYGRDANHLKTPKVAAPVERGQKRQPSAFTSTNRAEFHATDRPVKKAKVTSNTDPSSLHPSWAAKRQQQLKIAIDAIPTAGQKIVFED
jgi:hypothetical protein